MNKTAIKNFSVWARRKLISEITYKAGLLGITEKGIAEPSPQSTKDLQFFDVGTKDYTSVSGNEITQRNALIWHIKQKENSSDYKDAFRSVVEETAYTWFNRLIAIRFMEVNDYLPSRIRVLSSENLAKLEPDFVTTPFDTGLPFSAYERDRVMQLKDENKLDELFRMLFIKQCNKLNDNLPELFEKTDDYTELLLTISFTDKDGVVYHLVHDIEESNFNIAEEGQIEIIGWLYQYYNTEPKDEVFAHLKKNVKITKERIPAATQLFTPDWIVRYMVENSLGRLWLERERATSGVSDEYLNGSYFGWKYYLEEAEQEPDVEKELAKIREGYKDIKPEDIKVIDPCMGSGHILVYAFDVLMQIYESAGFTQRDAAQLIIEKNLYGLDIDDRAYQLAYFATMMKGRQYDRRFLTKDIKPNLYAIQDVKLHRAMCKDENEETLDYLLHTFVDAKEYGSILNINHPLERLIAYRDYILTLDENGVKENGDDYLLDERGTIITTKEEILPIVNQAIVLAQKYDVVVTNPPYMGSGNMNAKLQKYTKENYPNGKADMFAVFIQKCTCMTKSNGYTAMITQQAFMFLSSFEELRKLLISNMTITSMYHLGFGTFGADFGTTAFVLLNSQVSTYMGRYLKLTEQRNVDDKQVRAIELTNDLLKCSLASSDDFLHLPNNILAYWLSKAYKKIYSSNFVISDIALIKAGMKTGDNKRFLRLWYEVSNCKMKTDCFVYDDIITSCKKWYPYNKGGESRMWYGNHEYIINMENGGAEIISQGREGDYRLRDSNNYFRESLSWSFLTAGRFSMRYFPTGFLCDVAGSSIYPEQKDIGYLLAILTSKVTVEFLKIQNPTLNFQVENISQIPLIIDEGNREKLNILVEANIELSKFDWDSFETSWNFVRHPFLLNNFINTIKRSWENWEDNTILNFSKLQANEIKLNRIIIEIYGLQDELIPEVEDKDVTIRKADLGRDIRSFISYAVGCMFGRYSLFKDGLIFAGGEWDYKKIQDDLFDAIGKNEFTQRNLTFDANFIDEDNCIPITDEEYFNDDIVGKFVLFAKEIYGSETLEENLDFIANALGNKGNTSREVIRNYFIKDFYKDHCKIYQKRPIYWLFDSGKEDGFKALIYMHRYNADTIGTLRIDYLHKMQKVYESEISRMQETIDNSTNVREITAAEKRKEKLIKQIKETKDYDIKIAHLALARIEIDLDDGVKVNYEKVQTDTDGKKFEVLMNI